MDKIDIDEIKLQNEVLNILNKEKYSHNYKDIMKLEKNRKIKVKFIGQKENYNDEDYAIFEVYYKVKNKITLFKQDEIDLNYRELSKIYVKWNELF